MNDGLTVYAVNFDKVRLLEGSRDSETLRTFSYRVQGDVSDDESPGDTRLSGAMIGSALQHLFDGEARTLPSAAYVSAYHVIVSSCGHFLDNGLFSPTTIAFLQGDVQNALNATGTTLQLSDLLSGKALLDFPAPDGFPTCGYWSKEDVAQAARRVTTALDPSAEVVAIGHWLSLAASRGEGIVGFYAE